MQSLYFGEKQEFPMLTNSKLTIFEKTSLYIALMRFTVQWPGEPTLGAATKSRGRQRPQLRPRRPQRGEGTGPIRAAGRNSRATGAPQTRRGGGERDATKKKKRTRKSPPEGEETPEKTQTPNTISGRPTQTPVSSAALDKRRQGYTQLWPSAARGAVPSAP